jgi:glycerophosphoryl diester phosphodiesterase
MPNRKGMLLFSCDELNSSARYVPFWMGRAGWIMQDGRLAQVDSSACDGDRGNLQDIPLVAHRGYAARYPENTRESLAAAVSVGAKFLEFDIQLSADGVPVLLHDASLERTAGRRGTVFDLSAAELTGIEVNENDRLGGTFKGVRIPRLREVAMDLARWPGVTAFVEIKRQSLNHFGTGFTLDRVLDALAQVLDSCVVISFSADAVLEARRRCNCAIGWALPHWSEESRQTAIRLVPEYLFCDHLLLPPPAEALWQGPWRWVAYEVAEAGLAQSLVQRGVHMIETMEIAEMMGLTGQEPGSTSANAFPI